jgi:hypothetical protein
MFITSPALKVYLALGHTDMRKAINGLSIVVEQLELDPFSGHLFAELWGRCYLRCKMKLSRIWLRI